jgi:WG containing repeat
MLQKGYATKTENLYPINFSGKGYGYVNQAAQLVVEPQFDQVGKFSEGFAPVIVKNKWGFVNLKGQISITLQNNITDESNSSKLDDHDKSV